jgi:transcriptional regulator NrdR family protein
MTFQCPCCGGEAAMKDSRPAGTTEQYRRRRYHCGCGTRFTTIELFAVVGTGGWQNNESDALLRQVRLRFEKDTRGELAGQLRQLITEWETQ